MYQGMSFTGKNLKLNSEPTYSFNDGWSYYVRTAADAKLNDNLAHNIEQPLPQQRMINLPDKIRVAAGDTVVLQNTLPKKYVSGMTLRLRTSQQSLRILIDGKEIYKYDNASTLFGKSAGSAWHLVRVPTDTMGKSIVIELSSPYAQLSGVINGITYGSKNASVFRILSENSAGFIVGVLSLLLGILIACGYSLIRKSIAINPALLYLSIFAMMAGLWTILESKTLQLQFGVVSVVTTLTMSVFMLLPIPLLLFLRETYINKYKMLYTNMCAALLVSFTLSWVLQLLNVMDLFQSLQIAHLVMLFVMLTMLLTVTLEYRISRARNIFLLGTGTILVVLFALIDLARFYVSGGASDAILFTRIGMLVYVVFLAWQSMRALLLEMVENMRQETIAKLAYTDSLTGLENRRACEEEMQKIEALSEEGRSVTLVLLNTNNLRITNRTVGIRSGDKLILATAKLVRTIFAERGRCFRISDGEFLIFLNECDKAEADVYLRRLEQSLYSYNIYAERVLSVTTGMGVFVKGRDHSVHSVITHIHGDIYGSMHAQTNP